MKGEFSEAEKKGQIILKEEVKNEYADYFSSFANLETRKFKIVIDFANAMGILEWEVLKKFPDNLEIITLFENFDGKFPKS